MVKNLWNKIKNPRGIWFLLFCLFFIALVASTIIIVVVKKEYTIFHYILFFLSAISLTYFVYAIVKLAPTIKTSITNTLKKHKLTNKLITNYGFRTLFFSFFSFLFNMAYLITIGVFGIISGSIWYITITFYYLVLALVKLNIYVQKRKDISFYNQTKAYRFTGILFIFLTITLSGIIVLMYKTNMYFEYAGIMIYVFATYTFIKLSLAIYNLFKAKKQDNLYIQSIRNINLANASVSVLVLQVALFQAFSPENNKGIANGLTGGVVCAIILFIGIVMIVKGNNSLKKDL